MTKKDYLFGIAAGLFIGLLAMPVLQTAKPSLYQKFAWVVFPFFFIATPVGLLVAHWIGRKLSIVWQIAKFGVIGVLNTLVDWGILTALILVLRNTYALDPATSLATLGSVVITYYTVYKSISFIAAVINSYYWNKHWTFETSVVSKTVGGFIQFFLVSMVGFFINVGISSYIFKAVTPLGGLTSDQWGLVGAAIGSVLGLAWNFVGYKFIVFKNK
jgi:putative flippase GtrA